MHTQHIKKVVAIAAVALLSSGCSIYTLEELRHTTPSGSPFQKELARLYMDFAVQDEKGYDWFNSWYFADKGLRAAYGKEVIPENPKNWNLSKSDLPALQEAHGKLLVALSPQNEAAHPGSAASAQVYFDCWIQRQEENWQIDRIDYCRSGFNKALGELGISRVEKAPGIKTPKPHKPKPAEKNKVDAEGNNIGTAEPTAEQKPQPAEHKAKAAKPKAETTKIEVPKPETTKPEAAKPEATTHKAPAKTEAPETLSYVVFFASDKPAITEPGEQVLDDVIKSVANVQDYEILLKGGAGSDAASKLFKERAGAVTKRLVTGGIKADAITTGDGKGNSGRHIEIFLSQ